MAVFKKKKDTQHYVHRKNDVICHVKVEGGGGAEREGEGVTAETVPWSVRTPLCLACRWTLPVLSVLRLGRRQKCLTNSSRLLRGRQSLLATGVAAAKHVKELKVPLDPFSDSNGNVFL